MEKEIYLTETPYPSEPHEAVPLREKVNHGPARTQHKTMTRKLLERLPHENYYSDRKLKPGISFFKTILDIQQRRANGEYNGPMLKMNIPQTMLLQDNSNSLLFTDAGQIKVDFFASPEAFIEKLQLQPEAPMFPAVIHSSVSGLDFNNSILMSTEVVNTKVVPRSEGFISRRFVRPYADTPNLLRLYYTPACQRSNRKNHAYKLVNHLPMDEAMFRKKHRLTHHYLVNPEKQDSNSMALVKGKALEPFEKMAYSLVHYFEKAHPLKVTELVLDFIIDDNKTPWLLDVAAIRSKNLTKLWDIASPEDIELLTEKHNNSQLCKLCRMNFPKQELQKLVTNKLIQELTVHLESRGVNFPEVPHLRKEGLSPVCSVCYELIVAEHQLIDVQKQFSSLLNIASSIIERVKPPAEEQDLRRELWDENDINLSGATQPKLKAWRLFFYIERIKYNDHLLPSKPKTVTLELKFNNFKETFTKLLTEGAANQPIYAQSRFSLGSRVQSAKLHRPPELSNSRPTTASRGWKGTESKYHMSQATMASKVSNSQTLSTRENIAIEKIKVMCLYTKKHQPGNMFEDTELAFNLHLDAQHFEGRSFTLQQLKNKDTCQRHSSQVFLFKQGLEYCNLELTVGLTCDGQADLDDLVLHESHGIYYESRPSSICLPLPDEWMEVFTKGEEVPTQSKELCYEDIHREIPKLTKSRTKLKPMVPPVL